MNNIKMKELINNIYKQNSYKKVNFVVTINKIQLIVILIFLWTLPYFAQEKDNPEKQSIQGQKVQADFILEGRQGSQSYFVDETSIAEIYPKSSSKPKNVKVNKNQTDTDTRQLNSSSAQNSGQVRIVRNQDTNVINSLRNRTQVRTNGQGAKLSPVFQHSPGGSSFVLAGGIEILFPDSASNSQIESWLLSKGLRGKAIFPNSKVYIIESDSGFSALDLANLIATDPFPLEVVPLKTREMSLK